MPVSDLEEEADSEHKVNKIVARYESTRDYNRQPRKWPDLQKLQKESTMKRGKRLMMGVGSCCGSG